MSRQVQLRRGTAAEHETFTGAPGEVTVDTTNNTLRVHDGATPGGHVVGTGTGTAMPAGADYVTEWQNPTAENNYTWYRKYASGWVEQGGFLVDVTDSGKTATLPLVMANTQYTVTTSTYRNNSSAGAYIYIRNLYQNSVQIKASSGVSLDRVFWRIAGMAE
ncbi:hypothetical protein HDR66_02705 [bacterium]|nr:hypothetical protein [bacterium]